MTKRIGIVGIPGKWSTEALADAFEKRTGFRSVISMERVLFDSSKGLVRFGGIDLTSLDAIVIKKISAEYSPDIQDKLELLRYVRDKGVKVFSDPVKIATMVNRLSCTLTLSAGQIPMPATTVTADAEEAVITLEHYGKAVFKPLYSTKARGMCVIEHGPLARKEIEAFQHEGNPIIYMQRFVELPGRDLGLVFVGGKYIGTYARVSGSKSWNTTTVSGGRYEPNDPPQELIDLAHKAQALFGLDLASVDLAETADGPIVFEVSAFGGFRGLHEASGVNAAEIYADYVMQQLGGE